MSVKGNSSSKKEIIPPTVPTVPLYILAKINPDIGAQAKSANSPKKGKAYENIPMASNKRLNISCFCFLSDAVFI